MERPTARNVAIATLACVLFAGSAFLLADDDVLQFSDWSAPVNLGPVVNTGFTEVCPSISKAGLSLYFFSNRPGGFGGNDIWVSQRASVDDPWGPPQNLGPTVNTEFDDNAPMLSLDGHRLYFSSNRPGGFGGTDLYVSRRHNKRDDFAWQPPVNLGSGVNSFANELTGGPPFEDDETGTITLYFASNRPGGIGSEDIYASTLQPDETFGPAVLVEELSSPSLDRLPGIRRDGLEMFVTSNRPGGSGLLELWVSTRASTSDPWSMPVNLGPGINTASTQCGRLSFRGTALYFTSTRPGGFGSFDLYVSTRTKLKEPDEDND